MGFSEEIQNNLKKEYKKLGTKPDREDFWVLDQRNAHLSGPFSEAGAFRVSEKLNDFVCGSGGVPDRPFKVVDTSNEFKEHPVYGSYDMTLEKDYFSGVDYLRDSDE